MKPKEFIEKLVHYLSPTASPKVDYMAGEREIYLQVGSKDQGRIIGKSGINIAALIVVSWYYGMEKLKHPLKLVLLEPVGEKKSTIPFMPRAFSESGIQSIKDFIKFLLLETGTKESSVEYSRDKKGKETIDVKISKIHEEWYRDPDFVTALSVLVKVAARNEGIFLHEVRVMYE